MLGLCIKYDRAKGFGFIVATGDANQNLPDYFVSYRFIEGSSKHDKFLVPGQKVDFQPADSDAGPQARNVRKIAPITIAVQHSASITGDRP